ncbi:MAG: hypothetical protein E7Z73_09015 [Methanobrevibacter millerae]|uniref:Uncharacterized protein n=1 Tax=Methanobrevibacter millerae TaxID=230361 RepID=A0A8T3VF86_9EURY|nr:hypothetical protein [Methanobrevibacter millerae]MBE6505852.1 hypothetical protein [Methanobrevibacter millerae]
MNFGFSFVALIFLIMLFVPNIIWAKNKPMDYEKYSNNENRTLSLIEKIGQVSVVLFSLIFADNIKPTPWLLILILAFVLMILYELYWIKYFRGPKRMADMYSSFLGIPVAGATLPVLAFLLLGIYKMNFFLIISALILAVGHIGIHLDYERQLN